ncbi:class I SAM-dependent methyltransferase [Arenimonas alkanexedens]
MIFQDHFSGHAAEYARARPTYPKELFAWVSDQCRHHDLAWDVGCGNGQASLALAHHFQRVHASDASEAQIAAAPVDPRITWRVESAEHSALRNHSVDLVTAAQAYHWFNQERFCAETLRVLRPGGVVAVWCYGRTRVDHGVDDVFDTLYHERLGGYWPPERRHVDDGYRHLSFPFEPISDAPRFEMTLQWDLAQYLAYLRTWSSSQRLLRETGRDAVSELAGQFEAAWGGPETRREVRWPLSIRAGRSPDEL